MLVTTQEFYKEVVGRSTAINTPTALRALDRWNIPYFTNSPEGSLKKYWKVDMQHMSAAQAAYAAEVEARRRVNEKKKPVLSNGQDGPIGLMERMSAVEQELRTLNTQLSAFIAKFG